MSGRPYGYGRVSVGSVAAADNQETQRRVPTGCEKVFEDERSGVSDFRMLSIVALYFNRRPLRGHDADAQGNSLFRDFACRP